ncbi:hypothetical protein [Undibacterium crateris]|uniref:hypothetical protein n=1 Tax=Undibacterium crateris TaxID=2528175 RepID=UPI001389D0DC|nr:hypothetical protein [Undibacterium crateris]NDI85118.1 hypothetical protein [Undibacterium crateris]
MAKQVKQVIIGEDQLEYVLKNGNVHYYMERDQFSKDSKVPKNTLNKIMQGTTKDPSVRNVRKMYLALKKREAAILLRDTRHQENLQNVPVAM